MSKADHPFKTSCLCANHKPKIYRKLTLLLLDIWQREYDRRPYETLTIHGKIFEKNVSRRPDEKDYDVIIEFLRSRKLKTFELLYCPILEKQSLSLILNLKNIQMLSLCHNDLPSKAIEILSSIVDNCVLKMLRLTGNKFTKEHAEYLRIFLIRCKTILYLDVGFCDLDHIQLAIVADGIINCNSLKAVNISRLIPLNFINILDSYKISTIISIILNQCRLKEIHLKYCFLYAEDIAVIVENLPLSELNYLDFGSNNIGPDGLSTLMKAVIHSKKLIGLDISNNSLGKIGGEILAHYLPQTNIRFLDISNNGINAKMMKLILLSIKKKVPIRILNIHGNECDFEVGKILKRQIDAVVLVLSSIDVGVTYDNDFDGFRVVNRENERNNFNYRYNRVIPFYRQYDNTPNLSWHNKRDISDNKILINGLYLDSLIVNKCGYVHKINKNGDILKPEYTSIYKFGES